MSRQKRKISQSGLYHIIFRGISRQNIFEEDSDYLKLKEIIKKVKTEMKAELYAYCFMTNHVHLFIKENNTGDISKILRISRKKRTGKESSCPSGFGTTAVTTEEMKPLWRCCGNGFPGHGRRIPEGTVSGMACFSDGATALNSPI